jgi:predicted short-subunit dehydrogenase-like oxidoreductase (DUF2520 family)
MLVCCPRMKSDRFKIAIVGAGNLGSALALSLHVAGYIVSEIVAREGTTSWRKARFVARRVDARATPLHRPEISANLVWFCVPDRGIAACARELADAINWKRKIAVHSSGALVSDEIDVLRHRGAWVASVHPLMTFVPGVTPSLRGVSFAVEGDPAALRTIRGIVKVLGGHAYPIRKEDKAAYHTWGTFVSPLLTALLATSERVARAAGVSRGTERRRMLPIVRQTVENYAKQGGARGFSGPIVRGDADTIEAHLRVLQPIPEAREVYRALASAALKTLPTKNRKRLQRVLRSSS